MDFIKIITEVDDSLRQNRRVAAIRKLKYLAEQSSDGQSINELNNIETTYLSLFNYFIQGIPDSSRHDMLSDISEQLYAIRDKIHRNFLINSPGAYYTAIRLSKIRNGNLSRLIDEYSSVIAQLALAETVGDFPEDLERRKYDLIDDIFNCILASYRNQEDIKILRKVLEDTDSDRSLKIEIISAIILSLCAWYDLYKLKLLIDLTNNPSLGDNIRARLFIGIIFCLIIYPGRIKSNVKLCKSLECLIDNVENVKHIKEIVKAILGTKDTERVANKMKDELIPEIMKLRPEMLNRINNMDGEFDPESLENNPEWQEILDKAGITDKLQELAEMQNDGADLMMVTFAQLKKFPFFNKASNWFLPYDAFNPNISLDREEREAMSSIASVAPMMCDSDKYSLMLAMAQTPLQQRKSMFSHFHAQLSQMNDEIKENIPEAKAGFKSEVIKAVRDFYRFFNLGNHIEDFHNLFKINLDVTNLPIIDKCLSDPDFLEIVAEFYLKRGYYPEALKLFLHLSETDINNDSLWQKIGFCYQKQQNYREALSAYMKAEFLGGQSKWLTRKLAFVCRKLGYYDKALEYLVQALEDDPDNIKIILNAAHCAVEAGDLAAAINHYYHADYLNPDDPHIHRGIAWAEFLQGNYDKTISESEKYIFDKSCIDFLNLGHAYLLSGNLQAAFDCYKSAAHLNNSEFELAFMNDIDMLRERGVEEDSISLILDRTLSK